ncbi:MAG TPA: D-aminoacyl-tRNA deacylase, partial [Nitrospinota bacterium]|nr:D-aminoacyl-tRNA deacylase [Nitrospinota bacterium]
SFTSAAKPDWAEPLYEEFIRTLRAKEIPVKTGVFGAMMDVRLVNQGPVTICLDSKDL